MGVYSYYRDPYLKRVPTVIDRTYGIQNYDLDNLYPQRADEVRARAYTTNSAVRVLAEFMNGEGFKDPALAHLIMNSRGQTANDVLDFAAQDKAPFNGCAFFIKYNMNYRIMEVIPIEFMYCRLGLPNSDGEVFDIKYSRNWEMDYGKMVDRIFEYQSFPIFNPNPEVVAQQIAEVGWQNYGGQILYWTPKSGMYPKASFDPVFDNSQAQAEIGVYEVSSIQNNFGIEKVFKYPGKFESDEKADQFRRKLDGFKGAKGAKSTMIIEAPDGAAEYDLFEDIQMQNTDKMFEFTTKNVKNAIRECMSIPAALVAQLPENGLFNNQQIEDSYKYFNAITRGHRTQLSRIFKQILDHWYQPVTFTSYDIIPQKYLEENIPDAASVPGTAPGATPVAAPKGEFNEQLAGMTGKQSQNLRRIQRQYDQQKITKTQALAELKLGFGLSDEQALSLIDDDPNNDVKV